MADNHLQIMYAKMIDDRLSAMVMRLSDRLIGGVGRMDRVSWCHVGHIRYDDSLNLEFQMTWVWYKDITDDWGDFVRNAEAHGWATPPSITEQRILTHDPR